jgi:hypothetical protein
MDPSTSWNSRSSDRDEPFYCSPVCLPEDVICAGSDTEEAPEETQRKRLRYEQQAQRLMRGHLPVFQSAGLRGPFSKETGWVNPWRYRPRQKQEHDWWQPGSEDMLFTRENVMKRAVAHGLGYLSPGEALAWCKATAQAEAAVLNGTDIRGEILKSIEMDGPSDTENFEYSTLSTSLVKPSRLHMPTPGSGPACNQRQSPHSTANYPSDTPHTRGTAGSNMKETKRPVDSQWLKGSYVSKRARWDGPAIASPTPLPDVLSERDRRRRQAFSGISKPENAQVHRSSRLSASFLDIPKGGQATRQADEATRPRDISPTQLKKPRTSRLSSNHTRSSSERRSGAQQQQDEIDELNEDSQGSISVGSLPQGSRFNLRRSAPDITERSLSDLEPDDLVVVTPRFPSGSATTGPGNSSQIKADGSKSNTLPKLHCKRLKPGKLSTSPEQIEKDSFITEIAPSSRDLEKFEYRKKRRISQPYPKEAGREVTTPEDGSQVLRSSPGASKKQKVNTHIEDVLSSSKASPVKHSHLPAPAEEGAEFMIQEEACASREVSVRSWDMMEDSSQKPSFLHEANAPAATPTPPYSILDAEDDIAGAHELFSQHATKTDSQHSSRSYLSNHSQRLPDSPEEPLNSPEPIEEREVPPDLLDLSTQSTNTSSRQEIPTSQNNVGNSSSPDVSQKNTSIAKGDPIEPQQDTSDEALEQAKLVGKAQDEMEHIIQKALSQNCPSIGSEDSVENDPVDVYQTQISHENVKRGESMDHEPRVHHHNLTPAKSHYYQTPNAINVERPKLNVKTGSITVSGRENVSILPSHDEERFAVRSSNSKTAAFPIEAGSKLLPGSHDEGSSAACSPKLLSDEFIPAVTETKSSTVIQSGEPREVASSSDPGHLPKEILGGKDMECTGDDHPEATTAKLLQAESETSWEGCGPQSPWAVDDLGVLPSFITSNSNKDESFDSLDPRREAPDNLKSPSARNMVGESDWQSFERPETPEDGGIKPFKDSMSPTPSPEPEHEHEEADGLPRTQLLVEAATKNPWTSNFRNPSSGKSKKRVSFGVLCSEDESACDPKNTEVLRKQPPRSSPPGSSGYVNEEVFDTGATVVKGIEKHFSASAYQRTFKRILPENTTSPNSSPALGAQAEAFMRADRETSPEQERFMGNAWSPHLQPCSITNNNILRRDRPEEDLSLMDSTPPSTVQKEVPALSDFDNFDMDEALSEVNNFLEDWSVDTELQKAKELGNGKHSENTGYRRRRLFGLL